MFLSFRNPIFDFGLHAVDPVEKGRRSRSWDDLAPGPPSACMFLLLRMGRTSTHYFFKSVELFLMLKM
jgi:hypothetical protein